MKKSKKKTPIRSKKTIKQKKGSAAPPKAPLPATQVEPVRPRLFITGESPMVEQYAELCSAHGYDVVISWNDTLTQHRELKSDVIKISKSIPANVSLVLELTNIDIELKRKNIEGLDTAVAETTPILSSSITVTATEQATWISNNHRLVGIAALPTFIHKPLVEVAPTIYSPKETLETVNRFFQSIGKEIEIVQDRVGMVLPRILCRIINEAAFAVTEDIASPQDIDMVLKLGVHFPLGPLEWADQIGMKQVYAVLTALYRDVQEERYRVSPLLKQMAITRNS